MNKASLPSDFNPCRLCPRECAVMRNKSTGFCGAPEEMRIAKAMLHFGEEPPISGTRGSGTIFFSGCSLKCRYCQNHAISRSAAGESYSPARLAELFKHLEGMGAHNINLVTPTHYSAAIKAALDIYRPKIPIVYNTGGYEKPEIIRSLKGYIDIYLTDLKYADDDISRALSGVNDYFNRAFCAITEMIKEQPKPIYDGGGMMKAGVIIRHLVLPGYLENSVKVLRCFAENFKDNALLSLMSQYTPPSELRESLPQNLKRTLRPLEFKYILNKLDELEIGDGFIQDISSATEEMLPDFN